MDFPPRITRVELELELADEVMGVVPGPDLLRPRSNEDVRVESGIQFPSSTGCNHLFGVHLKNFSCCVSRRTCDIEDVKGVNCRGGYRCCSSGCGGPKRSLTLPRLFGDRSPCSLSLRGDLSLSPRLLGLRSRFFLPLVFSFCAEEFSRLDRRAASPLMYFSALVSTSTMLA